MADASSGAWAADPAVDLEAINAGLDPGVPTADVALYYPNNLDPAHASKVTPELLVSGFAAAKDVFGAAGVQLALVAFNTVHSTLGCSRSIRQRIVRKRRALDSPTCMPERNAGPRGSRAMRLRRSKR